MYDKQAGRRIYFYLCNDCGYMYAAFGIRDFAVSVNTVKTVQRNSRVVLDSFVMKNSIVIYDSD